MCSARVTRVPLSPTLRQVWRPSGLLLQQLQGIERGRHQDLLDAPRWCALLRAGSAVRSWGWGRGGIGRMPREIGSVTCWAPRSPPYIQNLRADRLRMRLRTGSRNCASRGQALVTPPTDWLQRVPPIRHPVARHS